MEGMGALIEVQAPLLCWHCANRNKKPSPLGLVALCERPGGEITYLNLY